MQAKRTYRKRYLLGLSAVALFAGYTCAKALLGSMNDTSEFEGAGSCGLRNLHSSDVTSHEALFLKGSS